MYKLIWSNGIKPERSNINDKPTNNKEYIKNDIDNSKINNNLLDIRDVIHTEYMTKINNRDKKNTNEKVLERKLVANNVSNPFLTSNKYIDDINNQELYLRAH